MQSRWARDARLLGILWMATATAACSTTGGPGQKLQEGALALSVADLQMHLRSDSYHAFTHVDEHGRNVFALALWRLDQVREQRHAPFPQWEDEDIVIEFARARALSRLRRHREAAEAYARVASLGGLLAEPARHHQQMSEVFASLVDASGTPEEETREQAAARFDMWANAWLELARSLEDPGYHAAALLESEAWEQARVEHLAAYGETHEAIRACQRLVHRHRRSKLYPRHLIRLGDLHAEAARREHVAARTERRSLDLDRYERELESAFSAYELASDARKPRLRREAQSKIAALLAYHEGVRSDVQ